MQSLHAFPCWVTPKTPREGWDESRSGIVLLEGGKLVVLVMLLQWVQRLKALVQSCSSTLISDATHTLARPPITMCHVSSTDNCLWHQFLSFMCDDGGGVKRRKYSKIVK
jgi:hypothetical protein